MNNMQGKKAIRQNQRRLKKISVVKSYWPWKQIIGRLTFVLLSVSIVLLGGRFLNQALAATSWNIDAPPSMVKKISGILAHENLSFWRSRPVRLRQQLLHDVPDLADVRIYRQLPNTLNIQVSLRQRIGLWKNKRGMVYLVDQYGEAYRALKDGENVDLPILRVDEKHLKEGSHILQMLRVSSPKWFGLSSEIFTNVWGWKINFGWGQQWLLPFGSKAVHNVALLSKIVGESPWSMKKWRINTRMNNRWFFRETKHEEVI